MNLAETTTSPENSPLRVKLQDLLVLVLLLIVVPVLYFSHALHNLPVPANVDEQTSLNVLEHFRSGSLNPQFFMYPTLYYYVTYPFVAFFPAAKMLFLARLVNFLLISLTAFVSYAFCKRHLQSQIAGVIAAICVVTSITVTSNGSYLCTDILLAFTSTASLYYLVTYFHHPRRQPWMMGMLLLGAAVGCKYTAAILFIAYCLTEMIGMLREPVTQASSSDPLLDTRISRSFLVSVFIAAGLLALLLSFFFPVHSILHLIANTRSNANVKPESYYLLFLQHMRHVLGEIGAASLVFALLTRFSAKLYTLISLKRLYYGLGILFLVFLISTPYSLITPKQFFFDLGALFRANLIVDSGHQQWGQYLFYLWSNENRLLVLLGTIGILLVASRRQKKLTIVAVYLALYIVVICIAHAGYWRYLTPILPLLYCGTGFAFAWLWNTKPKAFPQGPKLLVLAIVAVVAWQLTVKIKVENAANRMTDSWYASYRSAKQNDSGTVLYAGYTPWLPFQIDGLKTRQVSWAALAEKGVGSQMQCGDVLVLEKTAASAHQIDTANDATVTILLDDPRGYGQQVLQRSDCR